MQIGYYILIGILLLMCAGIKSVNIKDSIVCESKNSRIRKVGGKYHVEHLFFMTWFLTYDENDYPCIFNSLKEAENWVNEDEKFIAWSNQYPPE